MASSWGNSWGTSWAASWGAGAAPADDLIGRKYPSRRRRGIYHPRNREEVVDIEVALKDLKKERDDTAELLALTQSQLKSVELIADNLVNRNIRIEQLNIRINELEWNLRQVKDEEEMLMLLAFAVMET